MFLIQKYSPKVEGEICKCPKGEIKKEKAKIKEREGKRKGIKEKKDEKIFHNRIYFMLEVKKYHSFFSSSKTIKLLCRVRADTRSRCQGCRHITLLLFVSILLIHALVYECCVRASNTFLFFDISILKMET